MPKVFDSNEQWKIFPECGTRYAVSNLGRVRSMFTGKELKGRPTSRSRARHVTLFDVDGKQKNLAVARMVATAFLENPNGCKYVLHRDRNPLNDNLDNLIWSDVKVLPAESRELSADDIEFIRLLYDADANTGPRSAEGLAKFFGTSKARVLALVKGDYV